MCVCVCVCVCVGMCHSVWCVCAGIMLPQPLQAVRSVCVCWHVSQCVVCVLVCWHHASSTPAGCEECVCVCVCVCVLNYMY